MPAASSWSERPASEARSQACPQRQHSTAGTAPGPGAERRRHLQQLAVGLEGEQEGLADQHVQVAEVARAEALARAARGTRAPPPSRGRSGRCRATRSGSRPARRRPPARSRCRPCRRSAGACGAPTRPGGRRSSRARPRAPATSIRQTHRAGDGHRTAPRGGQLHRLVQQHLADSDGGRDQRHPQDRLAHRSASRDARRAGREDAVQVVPKGERGQGAPAAIVALRIGVGQSAK